MQLANPGRTDDALALMTKTQFINGTAAALHARRVWQRTSPEVPEAWDMLSRGLGRDCDLGLGFRSDEAGSIHFPWGRSIHYADFKGEAGDWSYYSPQGYHRGLWPAGAWAHWVSGVARDMIGAAIIRARELGLDVVGHVHDELIFQIPKSQIEVQRPLIVAAMKAGLELAPGLPIKEPEIEITLRYKK